VALPAQWTVPSARRLFVYCLFWQCLHVRNPSDKIGYFRRLKSEISRREPDGKKMTFPVGKPTASVYLVMIFLLTYGNPTQTPDLLSGPA